MLDPEQVENLPVVQVPISALLPADSPRQAGVDAKHVRRLTESEDPLPPIIVHRCTMQVVDGMHRLSAARMRGQQVIAARFFEGDAAGAFVLAVRANVRHGLPLSLADRKSAASRILQSYPQWSTRAVALASGLSTGTVAQLRECPTVQGSHLDARLGRDGRFRPVDGAERRAVAARLGKEEPQSSLREIARRAGISPETVRSVRAHLQAEPRAPAVTPPAAAGAGGLAAARSAAPLGRRRAGAGKELAAGQLLAALSADPAVRSSELGRLLLRALASSLLLGDRGEQLALALPDYRRRNVALAAQACAAAWQRFGQLVEQRGPSEPVAEQDRPAPLNAAGSRR
jgi:hypothetical protein